MATNLAINLAFWYSIGLSAVRRASSTQSERARRSTGAVLLGISMRNSACGRCERSISAGLRKGYSLCTALCTALHSTVRYHTVTAHLAGELGLAFRSTARIGFTLQNANHDDWRRSTPRSRRRANSVATSSFRRLIRCEVGMDFQRPLGGMVSCAVASSSPLTTPRSGGRCGGRWVRA